MKLLILGAGGHGKVVKEVAESVVDSSGKRVYEQIEFLDDKNKEAIGKLCELEAFRTEYDSAFVGIGNNQIRKEYMKKLETLGYQIPTLIHPSAYISKSCVIGHGTVVEPKAIVNTNAVVGKGTILSVGAIVDHDAVVGKYCHVNVGSICKAGSRVEDGTKVKAGDVVKGY